MKLIFSIPKPKPIPQQQNIPAPVVKPMINSFINIFSRLESSGSCKSCG